MLRIELVILPTLIIAFTVLMVGFFFLGKKINAQKKSYDRVDWPTILAIMNAVLGGLCLTILLVILIPFNPKYWVLTNESGEVTRVETRSAVGSQGGDSQIVAQVVLTLNSGKVVIMDDPRAQNIEVGDDVSLRCQTHWVYGGSDKTTCIPN